MMNQLGKYCDIYYLKNVPYFSFDLINKNKIIRNRQNVTELPMGSGASARSEGATDPTIST